MSNDVPTRAVRDETESAQDAARPLEASRRNRPDVCPNCDTAVSHAVRFCPSCRTFVPDRWVGELATGKRRLAAAFFDGMFRDGSALSLLFWSTVTTPGLASRMIGFMSGLYWISSLYLWSKGTTPAKRLFRMTVITEDGEPAGFGRMAFRETIGKGISTVVFGMGLISIPFDDEKQGWHDKMAGTWVVHDEEAWDD